jgi:hypothetical protein
MKEFNINEHEDSSFKGLVNEGCIMTWYSFKDNNENAIFLEYEEPGFTDDSLLTVENPVNSFKNTPIPKEFTDTIKALENGQEDSVIING